MVKKLTIAQVREANVPASRNAESMYFAGYEYRNGTVYVVDVGWKRLATRVPTKDWRHKLDCSCKFCCKESDGG